MTLIELSIKISKTEPAKTCTFHTDWKKCCIFQEDCDENAVLLFYSLGVLFLDHIRLEKGGGSTEEEQCTSTRLMN